MGKGHPLLVGVAKLVGYNSGSMVGAVGGTGMGDKRLYLYMENSGAEKWKRTDTSVGSQPLIFLVMSE